MGDIIKFRKGLKTSLPTLRLAEPGFTTDEKRLYIGGTSGNVPLPSKEDIDSIDVQLLEKANANWIINGGLEFWQRGTTIVNPVTQTYLADRFEITCSLTGIAPTTITHSRQTFSTPDIPNASNFYRIVSDSVGVLNSNDLYRLNHSIENGARKLCGNGKKVTISFYARSSITNKKLGVFCIQNYGSGGSPSSFEFLNGTNFILNNTWQKYSLTINTNTLVGKTFGSNNDDYLRVVFTNAYGSGTAQYVGDTITETFGIGYVDIAQIKLESGDKATLFVPRLYGEELALCLRYYLGSGTSINNGIYTNSMTYLSPTHVRMRANPSIASGTIWYNDGGIASGFTFTGSLTGNGISITANKIAHGINTATHADISGLDAEIY
jgi:hypothetical protein